MQRLGRRALARAVGALLGLGLAGGLLRPPGTRAASPDPEQAGYTSRSRAAASGTA
jgi:hypothetical protein